MGIFIATKWNDLFTTAFALSSALWRARTWLSEVVLLRPLCPFIWRISPLHYLQENNLLSLIFAKSLLVIPKTLSVNAAQDSSDLVAKLRAYHNTSQTKADHAHLKNMGLDLLEGCVRDNCKAGVFEPAISKVKSLKFATEAAITILRIDDLIKLEPERGEENAYQQAYQSGQLDG